MYTFSKEHRNFLKKIKIEKALIKLTQISIIVGFLFLWELLAHYEIINTFLFSSPSRIISTVKNLYLKNDLLGHIGITIYETLLSFSIASCVGVIVATILWSNNFFAKVMEPYLTIINSLPKVALGPLIIIWVGASANSIIVMALMISLILSIINIYNGFVSTNENYIKVLKTFSASRTQIFLKAVLPCNKTTIINSLKINISMSLIGVIMGELLVSKKGLGYLIMYGSQVFNINLVITSVCILGIVSYIIYYAICLIEKKINK
ncbi:MAG: ABC transporter permease [Bacilli bacterium]|nr:ABC transporter permease [Bacilli bacterium]